MPTSFETWTAEAVRKCASRVFGTLEELRGRLAAANSAGVGYTGEVTTVSSHSIDLMQAVLEVVRIEREESKRGFAAGPDRPWPAALSRAWSHVSAAASEIADLAHAKVSEMETWNAGLPTSPPEQPHPLPAVSVSEEDVRAAMSRKLGRPVRS